MLAADVTTRAATTTAARDHVFFSFMAVAMTAVVGAGFSRTYFHRIAEGSATPLIHIHGAVFAAWMVLFIAQALLAATGHTLSRDTQTHKRLMLMATLGGLVPAGAARLPGGEPTLLAVFLTMLAAGPVYDWVTRRRVHWAYVCGIAVTLVSSAIAAALAQTSGWQSFAQTLVD